MDGDDGRARIRGTGRGGAGVTVRGGLEAVVTHVRDALSPGRFAHVEGVVDTAAKLAERLGADGDKVMLAAWLHDVAREWEPEESLKRARRFGIIFSEVEGRQPVFWHAPLGAAVAREQFGIEDEDVLAAIRWHTTGRAGMSLVEKIVYLADVIEPGRTFPGVERLRELARTDFEGALLASLDGTLTRVVARGALLHPDSVAARNELLMHRS